MEQLNSWIVSLALALARPLGMSLMLPVLRSGSLGSALLRNGILISLTLPILPLLHAHLGGYDVNDWRWLKWIPGEVVIGLLLSFASAIPFWAVDMSGFLLDTLRGSTMATVFNPGVGVQSSLYGLLFSQFLCALFFISGGMNLTLSGLYDSYHSLPPGETLFFNHTFLTFIQAEWQRLYRVCLSFSLPAVICMVLSDLALGLLNRSAQQLNVFSLAMPVKSALTLIILLLTLPYAFHYALAEGDKLSAPLMAWFANHE